MDVNEMQNKVLGSRALGHLGLEDSNRDDFNFYGIDLEISLLRNQLMLTQESLGVY